MAESNTPTPVKVFISYSRKDSKAADRLEKRLENDGISVWRDYKNIGAEQFPKAIGEGIRGSDVVIMIWSEAAEQSEWVELEWNTSLSLKKRLVIWCKGSANLPAALSSINSVMEKDFDTAYPILLEYILAKPVVLPKPPLWKRLQRYLKKRYTKLVLSVLFLVFIAILMCPKPLPEMVHVPEGEYLAGRERVTEYLPDFWIDTVPVTNEEYKIFINATGHHPPKHWQNDEYDPELADHPVVNVTLPDARAYASWRGKRLPTVDEWEKTCRGKHGKVYPWGDTWQTGYSNTKEAGVGATTPVGMYKQNKSEYGCLDMIGNIWEWTDTPDTTNPGFFYIVGSAYNQSKSVARCYDSRELPSNISTNNVGFRCAIDTLF